MLPGYRPPSRQADPIYSDRDILLFEGVYASISPNTGELLISMIEEKVIDPVTVSYQEGLTFAESRKDYGHLFAAGHNQFVKHCKHFVPGKEYHKRWFF